MTKLMHLIEAMLLMLLFTAFRLLPLDMASAMGGWMARAIGPFMSAHKTAQKNLAAAFPEKPKEEREHILRGMWDHLGRVAAEMPHLPSGVMLPRIDLHGAEHFPDPKNPSMFFSGHIGNWEMLPALAESHGVPITLIYRQANNPYVDRMVAKLRAARSSNMFPKGPKGGFKLARAIKNGETLAMLIDQKMNDGIPVKFFGRDAMTAPAIAQLALRYGMPIIPAHIVRTKGAHFKGVIFPHLSYEKTGDDARDTLLIMTQINAQLESWVRQYPDQWFWVHKRWPNA